MKSEAGGAVRESLSEDVTFKVRTEGGRVASRWKIRGNVPAVSCH